LSKPQISARMPHARTVPRQPWDAPPVRALAVPGLYHRLVIVLCPAWCWSRVPLTRGLERETAAGVLVLKRWIVLGFIILMAWSALGVKPSASSPTSEEAQVSRIPWSGYWWPLLDSKNPNLYDDGGPLDEYDSYCSNLGWGAPEQRIHVYLSIQAGSAPQVVLDKVVVSEPAYAVYPMEVKMAVVNNRAELAAPLKVGVLSRFLQVECTLR
jgi:hypothetical protein